MNFSFESSSLSPVEAELVVQDNTKVTSSRFKEMIVTELLVQDDTKLTSSVFEEIVSDQDRMDRIRQCRWMDISSEDYKRVIENPGEFCQIFVSGGGPYTQWFFYHTLSREFVYIFRTFMGYEKPDLFTWQHSQHYESPSNASFRPTTPDDIRIKEDYLFWRMNDPMEKLMDELDELEKTRNSIVLENQVLKDKLDEK